MIDYERFSPRVRQTFVALGPILITTSLGMTEGFSAILLPQLNSTTLQIDAETSSWIASMAALPMAFGCILGGILMEKIGRRATHMLTCLPCIIGWLILYCASSITMILMGRFLTGFCVGLLGPPTGVYMSETSEPKFRGFLLASISFAIALGLFLSHLIGTFVNWQDTALTCCSFPVVCLVFMAFAPESPTWLAKMGRVEEAKRAFEWCRGQSEEATKELQVLLTRQVELNHEEKKSFFNTLKTLNKPEFTKPLVIIVVFFVTCQWAGLNAITFYSVSIIQETLGGNFDEYLAMLIIDTIRVFMSVFACVLLKKLGRRPLAIISGIGTFVSLFILSSFIFAVRFYPGISGYTFIPLVALVTYVSFITIGFVPLPWTMMGEVFPLAHRGIGSGISALMAYLAFFSVVKTTPTMILQFGLEGTFFVYGMLAMVGTIVLILFLPETKDKALYQIEDHFKIDCK
ncbi:facilitated trehalose transporter Tret1-2 homolog isoform X2 [Tribolium madens]|uniref:facilitated trehalose transporter Tret1-2 homolog isoform X2 n=1 Tax=Tribolium madens TaxID=41895 RepID=UPI001CF75681|nr:facilitated trehalose transporter Tret1-2 homolog isoform X2 [Tribolium madens]